MVPVCCIYLMKMPGHNRKARTASDWLLRLQFPPELAQTRVAFESGRHARRRVRCPVVRGVQGGDRGRRVQNAQR